jgi:hypothetical protein
VYNQQQAYNHQQVYDQQQRRRNELYHQEYRTAHPPPGPIVYTAPPRAPPPTTTTAVKTPPPPSCLAQCFTYGIKREAVCAYGCTRAILHYLYTSLHSLLSLLIAFSDVVRRAFGKPRTTESKSRNNSGSDQA